MRAAAFLCIVLGSSVAHAGGWEIAANMPTPKGDHGAVALADGRVLVVGDAAELFDPATGAWSAAGAPGEIVLGGRSAARLDSGDVLVMGGVKNLFTLESSAAAWLYSVSANGWIAVAPMSQARSGHTATLLPTGRVLVCGGTHSAMFASSCELWDSANSWVSAAPMNATRLGHAATLLPDGKVVVSGGVAGGVALTITEMLASEGGRWTPLDTLVEGRATHGAVVLASGELLVVGGTGGAKVLTSAELFSATTNQWTQTGSLVAGRNFADALLLKNGCALAVGGKTVNDAALPSAEFFDPKVKLWLSAPTMPEPRFYARATLLEDGRVLVTGGYSDPDDSGSVSDNAWLLSLSEQGEPCISDCQCATGNCSSGVCCSSACDGACEACDATGTCSKVPAGSDPGEDCADDGAASCGQDGQCDGEGACRLYQAGTSCGENGCEGPTLVSSTCNGAGECNVTSVECAPFLCHGGECPQACAQTADCISPNICSSGKCIPPAREPPGDDGCGCRAGDRGGSSGWLSVVGGLLALRMRRGHRRRLSAGR